MNMKAPNIFPSESFLPLGCRLLRLSLLENGVGPPSYTSMVLEGKVTEREILFLVMGVEIGVEIEKFIR